MDQMVYKTKKKVVNKNVSQGCHNATRTQPFHCIKVGPYDLKQTSFKKNSHFHNISIR